MDAESSKALAAFGFLTILENPEHGLFGGYLVLSPQGRPLEFRCSTPVVASRAQEILYGPTLRPYLLSDVIGQSLLTGSELAVRAVLTDQREMLPLALIRPEEVLHVEPVNDANPLDYGSNLASLGACVIINGCRVAAAITSNLDAEQISAILRPLAPHVFLAEPFDRIRAALTEAQFASQDAMESHDGRAAA
jgi:hypothetical protein